MQAKKIFNEVWQLLVAHWITAALLLLLGPAVSAWGLISANWSWPAAVAVAIVLIAAIISASVAIKLYRRSEVIKQPSSALQSNVPLGWNDPPQEIFGQHFENETVLLDGNRFTKCTFMNVTFVYEGTRPLMIVDCTNGRDHQEHKVRIQTQNTVVYHAWMLIRALKMGSNVDYEVRHLSVTK